MVRANPVSVLGLLGVIICTAALTGCGTLFGNKSSTVIASRHDVRNQTIVRAYSLDGLGLEDAPPQEIQVLMTTIEDMVVTKQWGRSESAIQVFGTLMTVRTTPDNHLLIEDYIERIRRIANQPHYSMMPKRQTAQPVTQ